MNLAGTRILITAGPTWAALDSVRVIGNIASGETGIALARGLARRGASVTLVLGQTAYTPPRLPGITVRRFHFFGELYRILEKEVSGGRYSWVVHAAAVCDYLPERARPGKIASGRVWRLKLVPAPKIIDRLRTWDPSVSLIGFKFEPNASRSVLVQEAKRLMQRSGARAVVANTLNRGAYRAYLVEGGRTIVSASAATKSATAQFLAAYIAARVPENA